MGKDKIQLLNQALNSASSSLNQAKQLLVEIERGGGTPEMPGLVGKYDGMFMITEAGKKYPVPDNYSAKTKLVYGDKLKMIEGPEGRRFKLLEEMGRVEEEAQLAVKDGHFEALTKGGSYKLIQGAVRYWGGQEGDKLKILLPQGGKNVPFAGLVEIFGRQPGEGAPEQPSAREAARSPQAAVRASAPEVKRGEPKPEAKALEKPAYVIVDKWTPEQIAYNKKIRDEYAEKYKKEKPVKREERKTASARPDKKEEEKLSVAKPIVARGEVGPAKKEPPKAPAKEVKKVEPAPSRQGKPAPVDSSPSKPPKPMDEEDLR